MSREVSLCCRSERSASEKESGVREAKHRKEKETEEEKLKRELRRTLKRAGDPQPCQSELEPSRRLWRPPVQEYVRERLHARGDVGER